MMYGIFLQAAGAQQPGYVTPVLIVLMLVVMYFFMLRPQQRRQKEQRSFVEGVSEGDWIVTNGGIHAKVASIEKENMLVLDIGKGTKILLDKSSISYELSKKHYAKK